MFVYGWIRQLFCNITIYYVQYLFEYGLAYRLVFSGIIWINSVVSQKTIVIQWQG